MINNYFIRQTEDLITILRTDNGVYPIMKKLSEISSQ